MNDPVIPNVSLIITYLNSRPASGEGELGHDDEGEDFLAAFRGGATTVLASDWAPGLETMLMSKSREQQISSPVDQAILDSSEEDSGLMLTQLASSESLNVDTLWAEFGDDDSTAGNDADHESALHDLLIDDLLS